MLSPFIGEEEIDSQSNAFSQWLMNLAYEEYGRHSRGSSFCGSNLSFSTAKLLIEAGIFRQPTPDSAVTVDTW